jgi:hypothetical protein
MVVWIGCTAFAQSSPDGTAAPQRIELLTRIRVHAIGNLERQPNYTCRETVERSHRLNSTHKFQLLDTVRLEVALVDGKEMFGWPGARKFEDMDLRNFVSQGAIGNGNFALHARAIFRGEAVKFEDRGDGSTGSQSWVRFAFQVPLARSGHSLQVGERKAIVAYHGSFDVDPKSLDLERIEVIADEIPTELRLTNAIDRVEYARTKIGSGEFLLPASSELSISNLDGSEDRNQVRFASCRQFTGESVLTFDDPAPSSSPNAPAGIEEIVLPPDLSVTLALLDDVDLTKAAIGDPVRARLQNDLKSKGLLLLSRNAIASGHITRVEHHGDSLMVGLRFDELEAPGVRARPLLKLDELISADQVPARASYVLSGVRPGEGIILSLGIGRTRLNRGLLMNWSTQR